ncbi:thioesterase II family protein [Streptomyces enissocaesilis]|uniref:Thioesterase domain-containing protein n=1 Tax=Streptomyces enissocaesilis TaxID=332589 RepID=A0ABN3XN03_9ACTN
MRGPTDGRDLVVSFPAAGAGGTTLEQGEKVAARRGAAYLALPNPATAEALASGQWQAHCVEELGRAADQASAGRAILIGHSMGGLSAIRMYDGLAARLALPIALLIINTPCPDSLGRIPTMSQLSDAEIAAILAHDGFPRDLLDDEDMLVEIADRLRKDAAVADRLAERVSTTGPLDALHVLSTRGDMFIPLERCAAWRHRVSGEFHLTITDGGHAIDESLTGVLERAVDSALAGAQAGAV